MACDFAHVAGAANADLGTPVTGGGPETHGYVHNVEEFPSVNGQGTAQPGRPGATWLRKDISTQLKMDKLVWPLLLMGCGALESISACYVHDEGRVNWL